MLEKFIVLSTSELMLKWINSTQEQCEHLCIATEEFILVYSTVAN